MKSNMIINSLALSLVLLFAVPMRANATTMLKYSTAELTTKANNIVVGKITDKVIGWNEDKTKIFTYTTIEVITSVKGTTETNTITIKKVGGIVDGVGMMVDGVAEYKTGEECVLFLKKHGRNFKTVGMMQGKYNIFFDPKSGKKKVRPSQSRKVMFMTRQGKKVPAATSATEKAGGKPAPAEPVPLDDFLMEIKSHLKKQQIH